MRAAALCLLYRFLLSRVACPSYFCAFAFALASSSFFLLMSLALSFSASRSSSALTSASMPAGMADGFVTTSSFEPATNSVFVFEHALRGDYCISDRRLQFALTAESETGSGGVGAHVVGDLAHVVSDVLVCHVDERQRGAEALDPHLHLPGVGQLLAVLEPGDGGLGVAGERGLELGRHAGADARLVDLRQELGRLFCLCSEKRGSLTRGSTVLAATDTVTKISELLSP